MTIPPRRGPGPAMRFLAAIAGAAVLAAPAGAVHLSPRGERGEVVFVKNCSSCHTVGGGRAVGPDLAGATERRSREWLVEMITHPGRMLDSGDPEAARLLAEYRGLRMPDLGVSREDAEAILDYLEAGGAADARTIQAPGPARPEGDPESGRALFTGTTPLRNGGAPCAACHAIFGLPGGGNSLGPDLTSIYADYGEEGIVPIMADLPFPTMKPVYGTRPLTPGEQAHLVAFLRVSAEREPGDDGGRFLLLGIGGFAALAGIAHIVWRRRLAEVRRALLRKTIGQGGVSR